MKCILVELEHGKDLGSTKIVENVIWQSIFFIPFSEFGKVFREKGWEFLEDNKFIRGRLFIEHHPL